jgi:hypothetical protein
MTSFFVPKTSDLVSVVRDQNFTAEQEQQGRENIGINDVGGSLTVREVDNNPSGTVTTLVFPNGTVTIVDGVATITGLQGGTGATGATGAQGNPGPAGATGAAGPNLVSTATATNITGPIVGNGSTIIAGSFGTTAGTFCEGNDSRLSDARTPTAHNHAASEITSGTIPVARGGTGLTSVGSALQVLRTNASGTALEFATASGGIGGSTGATDNRLLRSDGTGGATLQATGITVDDANNVSGVRTLSSDAITTSSNTFTFGSTFAGFFTTLSGTALSIGNGTVTSPGSVGLLGGGMVLDCARAGGFGSDAWLILRGSGSGGGMVQFTPVTALGTPDAGTARFGVLSVGGVPTVSTSGPFQATNLTASGTIRSGTYTVGTLPSAAANTRARAFVTDSNLAFNSTNLGSTVTASGSNLVPVFSNGTNWVIG